MINSIIGKKKTPMLRAKGNRILVGMSLSLRVKGSPGSSVASRLRSQTHSMISRSPTKIKTLSSENKILCAKLIKIYRYLKVRSCSTSRVSSRILTGSLKNNQDRTVGKSQLQLLLRDPNSILQCSRTKQRIFKEISTCQWTIVKLMG